jgi:hypothetical protein
MAMAQASGGGTIVTIKVKLTSPRPTIMSTAHDGSATQSPTKSTTQQ